MTLSTTGYTVGGNNRPLNCARILWQSITGAVTGAGTTPELAANDFTNQRWFPGALPAAWTLQAAADAQVDTVFIAAHNLGSTGSTVTIATGDSIGGAWVDRATVAPTDNSPIAVMFNLARAWFLAGGTFDTAGEWRDDVAYPIGSDASLTAVPFTVRRVRVTISGASASTQIGIIRAGVALQMEQPFFGGISPIGFSRAVETRHSISETGQWLGRTVQRQAAVGEMSWQHLSGDWYRANFAPFAAALPQSPFGLIQNAARMPESVAWCWTDAVPIPRNMGVLDYLEVSMSVTGLLE